MTVPLGVSVTGKHPSRYVEEARRKAAEWGLPFVARAEKASLGALIGREAESLLVLGGDGWVLHGAHGEFWWSPGMARVRIKRLERDRVGGEDVLLHLSELKPGDVVLDGTLGLGVDAVVCAYRVGPTGRVIGVEASLPLAILAGEGFRRARIPLELHVGRAKDVMRLMPPRSVDCVLLDPMFDVPKKSSGAFEVLRRFAIVDPLDDETLTEARRVARRCVLVKGARHGNDFKRLGLTAVRRDDLPILEKGPVVWARLEPLAVGRLTK